MPENPQKSLFPCRTDASWCITCAVQAWWEATLLYMLYGPHNVEVTLKPFQNGGHFDLCAGWAMNGPPHWTRGVVVGYRTQWCGRGRGNSAWCRTWTGRRRPGSRAELSARAAEGRCCPAPGWCRTATSPRTRRGSAGSCGGSPGPRSCWSCGASERAHPSQTHNTLPGPGV